MVARLREKPARILGAVAAFCLQASMVAALVPLGLHHQNQLASVTAANQGKLWRKKPDVREKKLPFWDQRVNFSFNQHKN